MLNNITIGQYYPVESPVHNLDPRVKIILTILMMVTVFMVPVLWGYIPVLIFVWMASRMARVPFKMLMKSLRPLRMILVLTFLLNLLFAAGEHILVQFGPITVSQQGILNAVHYSLRLVFLVIGTSLLTLTTSPVSLSDGLQMLLSPLKKLHFPAHELSMMMTIALRFIPTLMEETDKIMKAQIARGADFESGNLLQRAKAMIPLLVPLFVSAFRRAGDLAMAMESRCYHGGEGRTRLRVLKTGKNDWIALAAVLALLVLTLLEGLVK